MRLFKYVYVILFIDSVCGDESIKNSKLRDVKSVSREKHGPQPSVKRLLQSFESMFEVNNNEANLKMQKARRISTINSSRTWTSRYTSSKSEEVLSKDQRGRDDRINQRN